MRFVTEISLILLLLTNTASARWDFWEKDPEVQKPAQTQPVEQPQNLWSQLKKKVNDTWSGWFEKPNPAVAQSAPTSQPQQAPVAPQQAQSITPHEPKAVTHNSNAAKTDLKSVLNKFNSKPSLSVPIANVPKKNLKLSKDKIWVYDSKNQKKGKSISVDRVPELNIGEEKLIDARMYSDITIPEVYQVVSEEAPSLKSPPLYSEADFKKFLGDPVEKAKGVELIEIPLLKPEEKITLEKVQKVIYQLVQNQPYTDLPVQSFSADDLKLLRAQILFEQKDQCHIAAGIFYDLTKSQNEEVKGQAQLGLGSCLTEMHLPTEGYSYLNPLIKQSDSRFTKKAIEVAIEDPPVHVEMSLGEALSQVKDRNLIPKEKQERVDFLLAKYFSKTQDYKSALEHAVAVTAKSPDYFKAQYLASVAEYALKKLDESLTRQKTLAASLEKRSDNKEVLALVQLNLGRVAFQKGKFKESLDYYKKVPKEHPLWLPALTEQAWSQLQIKDAAGAIGNMHSIHSPYFKNVYKPESYIVRSIGYLNICQYGDAYKSLAYLDFQYAPWLKKVQAYGTTKKAIENYNTALKYLQGNPTGDVDGLPYQIIREVARQKEFLNTQTGINGLIEESGGYKFIQSIIEKDKKTLSSRKAYAQGKVAEYKSKIDSIKVKPEGVKNLNSWKHELSVNQDFVLIYDFKLETLKEGQSGLGKLEPKAIEKINSTKLAMKEKAGKIFKKHLGKIQKDMEGFFENNELVKYEILAGSGENLRYKIAGGKTGGPSKRAVDRSPSGEKWDFDGEYWEDEIGNYRSSLKNNCQATSGSGEKKEK